MSKAGSKLHFECGKSMKNRFMLAPMTNTQSHDNGILSDDELKWMTMRAEGDFGLVMTCASHVQAIGKGFPGQLGIFSDDHIEGHLKLTKNIRDQGGLSVIQLHHAGMRSPHDLINTIPVCPSDNEETKSRALSLEEVHQLREDFINAATRSKACGYDGVEVHGAHGYILTQFLSSEINFRTDEYGGSLENRSRLIFEIVTAIRQKCGADFLLGVRFSPERFGMNLVEVREVCQKLIDTGLIDFLDISLWDSFKMPNDENHQDGTLLEFFKQLDFKTVKWTVAGKINTGAEVQQILDQGVDFVSIGRSAIKHHDFPKLVIKDPNFNPVAFPVTHKHLEDEGLGEKFITYLKAWPGMVAED